jgi:hypothetical protein
MILGLLFVIALIFVLWYLGFTLGNLLFWVVVVFLIVVAIIAFFWVYGGLKSIVKGTRVQNF